MDRGGVGWRRNFAGPGAGDFPGRGGVAAAARAWPVVHWRDQPWSRSAEAMSRAGVPEGRLAEATERAVRPFAWAGFLEEALAEMTQAWC
jgi:hypothetical protein